MAQQVLVEDGTRQVGDGIVGANMQLRLGIRVFGIDDDKAGRCGIGQVDEDVVVAHWSYIVEVIIDGL